MPSNHFKIGQTVATRYGAGRIVDYVAYGMTPADCYFVVQFGNDRKASAHCAAAELSQVAA